MSSIHHLAWGPRLDFTYGPLGFLTIRTLYFGSTAGLAFLYQFVVEFALFVLLIRFTRTTLPLLLAVFVSFGIGATAVTLTDSGDLLIPPAFLLGVLAVRCQQRTTREWLIAAISVLSALGFLIKFGDGLVPLGIVAVLIAVASGSQRIRGSVIAVAAFLSSLLVAWTATGNNLGALFDYFKYSSAVAKGYSSSMQLESGRTDEWWYAAIILAMLAWLAWASVRTASQREQLGTAAILTVYSWWALKEGFVRHDGHDLVFFGSIFVAFVVVGVISPRFRPMYIAIVAFVAVIAWTAAGAVPSNVVALSADAHAFGHQIDSILSSRLRSATINQARIQMQGSYALSDKMLSELGHRTVAIEPSENSVAWAYPELRWDPEPIIQSYSAYTSALDTLDARFIQSSAAPSRILEQPPTAIDGRNPAFDPPATFVAVMCRYIQLDASATWQVLGRVRNRCGPAHLIARQMATFGASVQVPTGSKGAMVVATFQSLPLSFGYKISADLLKPPIMFLKTSAAIYRFIPDTAADLHLMRPPSSLGSSAPFFPATISSFKMEGAGVAPGTGHFLVSFYSMAMSAR